MALDLQKLCQNADYLYGMRVLAGEDGMNTVVQWVHTIEEIEVGNFLHGGELIFTTGIASNGKEWLLPFVKKIEEKQAAGLVVNVGPYIDQVPCEVLEYANDRKFPVLEVPWKTRLVDITRDFCNQIIREEQKEEQVADAFRNLLHSSHMDENQICIIEKYGFRREAQYCVVAVRLIEREDDSARSKLYHIIQENIEILAGQLSYFQEKEQIYMICIGCDSNRIEFVIENVVQMCHNKGIDLYVGIGPNVDTIYLLKRSYDRAIRVMTLSQNTDHKYLVYDKLDSRKILICVEETMILQEYYKATLGMLEDYDKEHDTNYIQLLKRYITSDGSIQRIAEEENLHRNTVNYQLNKIKKIIENEIGTFDDKFRLMLAFRIKEISQ
ncbi:PucR family transcriptional regulator [Anaerosporobacter faecicola]|uniref:PucR family transcriptional regulator n=1 Tax=Anaerosporobacter faecicola TaxID=2718714 RepID=UPI00143BF292|nr:PucR family transcriptional regulator ligand-binding domain-containing protein [Anaerosporobacter faecicola]